MAQGTHEGWEACRAEELKAGDRVRVTVVGAVQKSLRPLLTPRDVLWGAIGTTDVDAGKLERQVRPLEVGDAALADGQPVRILAIDDVYAWVRQEDDGYHRYTVRLSVLERASDAP